MQLESQQWTNIVAKTEALHLAMTKHLANQALDKLQAEGVIKSHTMATSSHYVPMGGSMSYHTISYPAINPSNLYSHAFARVWERLQGLATHDHSLHSSIVYGGGLISGSTGTYSSTGGYTSSSLGSAPAVTWTQAQATAILAQEANQLSVKDVQVLQSKNKWQSLKDKFTS